VSIAAASGVSVQEVASRAEEAFRQAQRTNDLARPTGDDHQPA
jgi:hypothetical protein